MSGSGLIYAVILAMWGVYLVPKFVRRHDEMTDLAEARESRTARVLERRAVRSQIPDPEPTPSAARRARARLLARRRRVLLALAALTAVSGAASVVSLVTVAIPVGLTVLAVGYVVHLRRQACQISALERRRRAREARRPRVGRDLSAVPGDVSGTSDGPAGTSGSGSDDGAVDRAAPVPAPRRVKGQPESDLWAPLPITLPTYVTKPVALRPGRVIDLSVAGPWTTSRVRVEPLAVRETSAARNSGESVTTTTVAEPQAAELELTVEDRPRVVNE